MPSVNKTLIRRVVIRECDFYKILKSAQKLYTRVEFDPMTQQTLEQRYLISVLRQGQHDQKNPYEYHENPKFMVFALREQLYTERYLDYKVIEYDPQGYIQMQYNARTPQSRLGWATMELDYALA